MDHDFKVRTYKRMMLLRKSAARFSDALGVLFPFGKNGYGLPDAVVAEAMKLADEGLSLTLGSGETPRWASCEMHDVAGIEMSAEFDDVRKEVNIPIYPPLPESIRLAALAASSEKP